MTETLPDKKDDTNERQKRLLAMVVISILAAVVRFGDLGRQSPWLDELTNWQLAQERGIALGRSAHWLTGLCQSLGLAMSDSALGLRLYAAVFGLAAVIVGTGWAVRQLGFASGCVVGVLLALSPFGIFYSQDANHYAPMLLAGVLAVVFADAAFGGERARWGIAALAAGGVALSCGFHPTGFFVLGALMVVSCVAIFVSARTVNASEASRRWRRIAAVAVPALALAGAAWWLTSGGGKMWTSGQQEGRRFGLNWDFVSATLASFYGGIYRFRPVDVALGITGMILSIGGFVIAARSERHRWAAIGAVVTMVCVIGPFAVIQPRQYFSPRYLAAASPVLLIGIGFLFVGKGGIIRILKICTVIWGIVFCGRSLQWEAGRLRGSFQPANEAIEWIAKNAPQDSVVLTRHPYSSLGTRFLWNRSEMGGRKLTPLSFLTRAGAPSIQQAREIVTGGSADVYFVSLIDHEEFVARDFAKWLEANSHVIAHLPSTATDAFVPIDWGITIRKLDKESFDPLSLPRDGAFASNIFPSERMASVVSGGLMLKQGSAAAYHFQSDGKRTLQISYATSIVESHDYWLTTQIDDDAPSLIELQGNGEKIATLPGVMRSGPHTLTITFPLHTGEHASTKSSVTVKRIEFGSGPDGKNPIIETRQFVRQDGKGEAATVWMENAHAQETLEEVIPLFRGDDDFTHPVVAGRTCWSDGLPGLGYREEFVTESGQVCAMWPVVNWVHEPIRLWALIDRPTHNEKNFQLRMMPSNDFYPRGMKAGVGPMSVYERVP